MANKGTKQGCDEEIELVQKLNSNKNSALWARINLAENKNYYAVRCTKYQHSSVSNQKVLPKTDIFIIKSLDLIHLDDYYLDEHMLDTQKIIYTYVLNSGISVKEKKSTSYTYQKMTIETFCKIFGNYELGCAIEYYTSKNDSNKNLILETAWHTNKVNIIQVINTLAKEYNYSNDLQLDNDQNIKRTAIKLTQHIINNNSTISDFIFKGIGAFQNPYYALFIYKGEQMYLNDIPKNYSITSGSGRTNGVYTVVIKP